MVFRSSKSRLSLTGAAAVLPCLLILFAGQRAGACGLNWTLPRSHFDSVDPSGFVCYWEKIGAVDCGDGLVLPLQIGFNSGSDAGAASPYLGQGWILPLLESRFVQTSEGRFYMTQPDGWNNLFVRDTNQESVLNGSAGWKAQLGEETITAWAPCGWKLVFAHGKIASMSTPKGRKLDYIYEGGRVNELREGNLTRLKVEYDAQGKASALSLADGKRILLAQDKKPRVQSVGGQNVVTGVDSSLSDVTLTDGTKHHYGFDTDDQHLPTLTVEGAGKAKADVAGDNDAPPRVLAWNPQSKLAVRDGGWTYQITPAMVAGNNAAIGRTDAQGKKEYWFRDGANGQETTRNNSGVTRTESWFVSGTLYRKVRKIEETGGDGKKHVVYQPSYDEKGQLFRETTGDGKSAFYSYDDKGRITEKKVDGKLVWTRSYDAQGRLKEETFASRRRIVNDYREDGTVEKTTTDSTGKKLVEMFLNGRMVKRVQDDGATEKYEYSAEGKSKQVTDAHGTVWGYRFGESGEVIETSKNGRLLYRVFTDGAKAARVRLTYGEDGKMLEAWDWINHKTFNVSKGDKIDLAWVPLS